MYYLYMVRCKDRTLYTGITTDLKRRVMEHNESKKGAKYTKARRPVILVYHEEFKSRGEASKREYVVKKLNKIEKEELILKTLH